MCAQRTQRVDKKDEHRDYVPEDQGIIGEQPKAMHATATLRTEMRRTLAISSAYRCESRLPARL